MPSAEDQALKPQTTNDLLDAVDDAFDDVIASSKVIQQFIDARGQDAPEVLTLRSRMNGLRGQFTESFRGMIKADLVTCLQRYKALSEDIESRDGLMCRKVLAKLTESAVSRL